MKLINKSISLLLIILMFLFLSNVKVYATQLSDVRNVNNVLPINSEVDVVYEYYTKDEAKARINEIINEPIQNRSVDNNSRVILIYEAIKENFSGVPKTFDAGIIKFLIYGLIALTILLIVITKDKKRKIAFLLILSLIFGSNFTNLSYALNRTLANYDTKFKVAVGNNFPEPKKIIGYKYIGYVKENLFTSDEKVEHINNKPTYVKQNNNFSSGSSYIDNSFDLATSSEVKPSNNRDKGVIEIRTIEKEIILPYKNLKVIYVNDENLELGKVLKKEGINGKEVITYEVIFINGKEIEYKEVKREIIDPVATTIYVGIKKNVADNTNSDKEKDKDNVDKDVDNKPDVIRKEIREEDEKVPFEIIEIDDESLDEGVVEEEAGEYGLDKVIYEDTYKNDELISSKKLNTIRIKTPRNKIIRIGTKKVKENVIRKETREEQRDIPFSVRRIDDESLDKGKVIEEPGEVGISKIIYEDIYENDVLISSKVINTITVKEPKDKVIRTGTKKIVRLETRIEEEDVPFDTVRIDDETLDEGRVVEEAGEVGRVRKTYEDTYEDDIFISSRLVSTEEIKAPKNKVIKTGTKRKVVRKEERTEEINIPFDTVRIDDETLDEGRVVEEPGELGISRVVYEDTYEDDVLVSSRVLRSEVVREPRNKVIKTGTKRKVNKKPVLSIYSILKQSNEKKITVDYNLIDEDNAYISAKAKIYKKSNPNELVKELEITSLNDFDIGGLELNIDYILKTELKYNDGTDEQIGIEESIVDFILDFRKIELKYIKSVRLYKGLNQIISLESIPDDLSDYYVYISSDRMKDIVLPVKSIETAQVDGKEVYRVGVHTSELTHDNLNVYADDYYFNIEKITPQEDRYTSFSELIAAIKRDPSGTFILGANIAADISLQEGERTYINEEFTGTILGNSDEGKKFAIYGLKAPLFNTIRNARILDVDFRDVDINTNDSEVAAIAKSAYRATIRNVAVQGDIKAKKDVAGLVYKAGDRTRFTNVLFSGNLTASERAKGARESVELRNLVGGIVAHMENRAAITKAKVFADIKVDADSPYHKIGAIAGLAQGTTRIENVYAKGTIINVGSSNPDSVQIGGMIGSTWQNGVATNLLSEMKVTNGSLTYGDRGYRAANVTNNFTVEGEVSGKEDVINTTTLSRADADAKLESFDITINLEEGGFDNKKGVTDYSNIDGYDENKKNIYANIEKLIPFYDKPSIVTYGNKVTVDSNFATKTIEKTLALMGKRPFYNLLKNKAIINELLVIYTDGSTEILPLIHTGTFSDTNIEEYNIEGTELIYTPELFAKDYTSDISSLVNEMKNLDYMSVVRSIYPEYTYSWSTVTARVLAGIDKVEGKDDRAVAVEKLKENNVDPYDLKESYEEIKENIDDYLIALLERDSILDKTGNISPRDRVEYIRANKEKIMLGLAYINRWYNVRVGDFNLKEFTMYNQDIFGKDIDNIENLIKLATLGDNNIKAENNVRAYANAFGAINGKSSLISYLEAFKDIFDKEHTMNEWFKNSTKALIYESQTTMPEISNVSTEIWYNLKRGSDTAKSMILPLLSMKHEGLAVLSTTSTLHFSPFSKYIELPESRNYDNNEEAREKMTERLRFASEQTVRFFEFWYRMSKEEFKDKVFNNPNMPILVWDGYRIESNKRWRLPFTPEEVTIRGGYEYTDATLKEFFAPISKWYRPNGLGAYATGKETFFVVYNNLDKYGSSVMTHETTHNLDASLFFEGYGRRDGMGAEDFAAGMLQSIADIKGDMARGFNIDIDYNTYENGSKLEGRIHNASPERFMTRRDLEEFFERSYEFTYLTARAEAEAILELSKADMKYILSKVDKKPDGQHYKDSYRAFTEDELNNINTFEDLISNNAVVSRRGEIGRNTYATENMFLANYGAYTTDKGGPGSRTFKQTAFEMLAAGGYDAFIAYVSNKYRASAIAENKVLSDEYILKKVFEGRGDYTSFNELRRAMYQKVYAKKDRLKPFTINGVTYNTYEDLKTLLREKVQADVVLAKQREAANKGFHPDNIVRLKADIYRYYMNTTNDFRESIFN